MNLLNQVAIVTGGAVRLGREIALALAREGVDVCVHYGRSTAAADETAAEIRALGQKAVTVSADLREPVVAARAAFDAVCAEWGRVDLLINCAAVFEAGTLAGTTEDQWDLHFDVNLKAPLFMCSEFAARLEPGRRGHILNIVDWRATRPVPGHLAYTLTKSALVAMTRVLAQELAPRMQVNAVAPGAILPPPGEDAAYLEAIAKDIPLGRVGAPEDVTRAILYLLKSDFVTGEVIHVTGGQEL